jgi:GntR family transcriptional regulator / MocR family aminotransferase
MAEPLIYLDPGSPLSLQNQIREKLVELIVSGAVPPGTRLPSTRGLAEQLGVSRNTVVLAYQQLLDEGFLLARERSGIYPNPVMQPQRMAGTEPAQGERGAIDWTRRIQVAPGTRGPLALPDPARLAGDSFLDGSVDPSLYPMSEWREVSRLALASREIREWSARSRDLDDPMLIEQIRSRILPRRGIIAAPEQILITVGAQQALWLLVQLLVRPGVRVGVEEPGYPDFRALLALRGAAIAHLPVDAEGLVVDEAVDSCEVLYLTPSHQVPTAVTMPNERRQRLLDKAAAHGIVLIEDDADSERNYLGQPHPALRAMDRHSCVLYVSSLSKVLAPWLRLGFLVAPRELIEEARELRRLTVRHPPPHDQRAAALFMALGHYDAMLAQLGQVFRERWIALRDALNYHLQRSVVTAPATGGTSCWVQGPPELDAVQLMADAARGGVHIEPVDRYYAAEVHPRNCFRMSVRGIRVERIRPAVVKLADLVRVQDAGLAERLDNCVGERLRGEEIRRRLSGRTIHLETVYGDPCTIDLLPDGRMVGRSGFADEDRDTGRWWVDGDLWFRQWQSWAYGDAVGYYTVLDGCAIKWFNPDGRLYNMAKLSPPAATSGRWSNH